MINRRKNVGRKGERVRGVRGKIRLRKTRRMIRRNTRRRIMRKSGSGRQGGGSGGTQGGGSGGCQAQERLGG